MSTILELFEVKIRKRGDRITSTGKKVEGGKIVSRHFWRKDPKQAEDCAKALRIGSVVNVKRVRREDIIGDLTQNKSIRGLITKRVDYSIKEVKKDLRAENDVMVQDLSLSSIVYGDKGTSGNTPEQKEKRARRLEYNRKHEHEKEYVD